VAKKEARARAKVQVQHACTDDDVDNNDYSSEGYISSADALTGTSSSEEVTSRKRLREEVVASLKFSLNIFFRSFYV
jgi:hypothetical protein